MVTVEVMYANLKTVMLPGAKDPGNIHILSNLFRFKTQVKGGVGVTQW